MNCPVCHAENSVMGFKSLFDDRYGYPDLFDLFTCSNCEHAFLEKKFSTEEISRLYSDFYPRSQLKIEDFKPFLETSAFTAWLDGARRSAYMWVPPSQKILDIGCGFCQTLDYHTKRGCEVWGVEADENVRSLADVKGFRLKTGLFSSDDYEASFFDYVTLDQVLEHLVDPITQLRGIARILKPGGDVILSIPNAKGWGQFIFGRKWINWHIPYHLQHFSKKSISQTLSESGFDLVSLKTITSSEWLYYQAFHILTFPKLNSKSVFWDGHLEAAELSQKVFLRMISLLHRIKIFHLITRLMDMLAIGDNLLVIARKSK